MHKTMWIAGAMLAVTSTFGMADESNSPTRQERMDTALANYRTANPTDTVANANDSSGNCNEYSSGGTFARAEAAAKRGACKTGHAIERGVKKTGHAIDNAGRKTGDALRRTGEKMGGSSDKATSDPQPR
jgi:hypothetical protein